MLLVCLSLGTQSSMGILRQVVCVASVNSVVAAGALLPPLCQKHDAASSVSSV